MEQQSLFTAVIPPRIEDVKIYFNQKGMPEAEAESFFFFYEKRQWKSKNGNYLKSWKNVAYSWIASILCNNPKLFNRAIH